MDEDTLEKINDALNDKDASGQVEAIREIFDEKGIKMKSHMRSQINESFQFARLYTLANALKIDILKTFCDEEITLRVSNDRLGRREAVDIARNAFSPPDNRGFFGKLFGR